MSEFPRFLVWGIGPRDCQRGLSLEGFEFIAFLSDGRGECFMNCFNLRKGFHGPFLLAPIVGTAISKSREA